VLVEDGSMHFDSLIERMAMIDRGPRIALACQCAVRVQPVYDAHVGAGDPVYVEAVELAWRYAEGGAGDPEAAARVEAAVRERVDFHYDEEDYALMAEVATVALRAVQALDDHDAESALAVARALISAQEVADSAEAEAQGPFSREPEQAAAEEEAWQEAAIAIAEARHGPAARDMFDAISPAGRPRWLRTLLASKRR
jgi:hypothetical protein